MLHRSNYFSLRLKIALCSLGILSAAFASGKGDTVTIIRTNPTPGNSMIASNIPPAIDKKKGYDKVPLAGQKSYFGEKNDFVNDYTRRYLELHYNTLGCVQNKSTTPFSVIDNELKRKNLPMELKYLAVIESALNYNAVSKAGAVGPWQLMKTTAEMLGLTVNRGKDERRDIHRSTLAATRYLEILYSDLNDWLLVIAAYNCGPTPVLRAIERTGSRSFWDIKEQLPRETQGHVLAFIATASIFENLSKFINLGSLPLDAKFGKEEEPVPSGVSSVPGAKPGTFVQKKSQFTDDELKNMAIVRITEPLYLDMVAQETGMDKKQLVRWNTDYDMFVYNTYPTPFYNFRIPKDKLDIFLSKKEQLTKKSTVYYSNYR
ncbi:MAG: hypothetical protein K0Q79_3763 [Flavipsychrobacter sp.]|nr:hypothetical protein [Flavipsychrobacter sp.]